MKPTVPPEPVPPTPREDEPCPAHVGPNCGRCDGSGRRLTTEAMEAAAERLAESLAAAPPTLDQATLVKALEAAKAESVAVYKEYNERIDGFLKRGGAVRDEVYYGLTTRLDAAMWSSQRVSAVVDRALAGTPTPAAAPPTVAPAREGADKILCDLKAWYRRTGGHSAEWFPLTDRIVALVERDRASRSPGVPLDLVRNAIANGGRDLLALIDYLRALPSAGLEATSSSREGKEPESPALSGLDAATVEACARRLERIAGNAVVATRQDEHAALLRAAADLRALATPPGQAKP